MTDHSTSGIALARRIPRLFRAALIVACLSICSMWVLLMGVYLVGEKNRLNDFAQEWTSARDYFTGRPVYYDFPDAVRVHLEIEPETMIRYNAHPPSSILLTLPLGLLGFNEAFLLWTFISLACLVVSLYLILRERGIDLTGTETVVLVTMLVAGNALGHHLIQGQINLILLLLITLAWIATRRDRDWTSGVLIGIAAAIKVFPGFLVLYFLAKRKWQGLLGVIVGFLMINLLTLTVLGLDTYGDYVMTVLPEVSRFKDTWMNASMMGFVSKLLDGGYGHVIPLWKAPLTARVLSIGLCATVVAVTLRATSKTTDQAGMDLAFATCVLAMLLVSPITWDHYFVLAVLPAIIVWNSARGGRLYQGLVFVLALLLITINPTWIWSATIPSHIRPGKSPATPLYVLTVISCQFYALTCFLLLALQRLERMNTVSRGEDRLHFTEQPRQHDPGSTSA